MEIAALFRESFLLLLEQPKLFLPKIFVAALYGIAMLAAAALSLETFSIITVEEADAAKISFLFASTVLLLLYTLAVLAVDVLINAMYPILVKDFKHSKAISFNSAFRAAISKFHIVFPAVLVAEFAIALPFAVLFSLLVLLGDIAALAASFAVFLAVSFAITILFYVIYPIAVLREKSFASALLNSFAIGKSNFKQLSIPSIIPFFLSLADFVLAFFASNAAFLAAFVILRFLLAMLYAYHMVLNPNIYFALLVEGGRG